MPSSIRPFWPLLITLALGLFAWPTAVRADSKAEARQAYSEAEAEYNLGDFERALASFEKAYKIARVPAILFNIAQCHRQLKRLDRAASTYRSFIRLDPTSPSVPKAQELLAQVEAALKAEQSAARAPPLEQAPARLSAPSDESSPLEAPSTTRQGAATPSTKPTPAPSAALHATEPAVSGGGRPFTWIAGGTAVVAVSLGALYGLKANATAANLSGTEHDRSEADNLQKDLKSQAATANILFGVSAGLAVLAGTLFFLEL